MKLEIIVLNKERELGCFEDFGFAALLLQDTMLFESWLVTTYLVLCS